MERNGPGCVVVELLNNPPPAGWLVDDPPNRPPPAGCEAVVVLPNKPPPVFVCPEVLVEPNRPVVAVVPGEHGNGAIGRPSQLIHSNQWRVNNTCGCTAKKPASGRGCAGRCAREEG